MNAFGEKIKDLRREKGLTLRELCRQAGLDPGNYSRIERGRFPPPADDKIVSILSALGVESDDYPEWIDLARVQQGHIPADLMSDEELVKKLPILFRSLRRNEADALRELAEDIRKN